MEVAAAQAVQPGVSEGQLVDLVASEVQRVDSVHSVERPWALLALALWPSERLASQLSKFNRTKNYKINSKPFTAREWTAWQKLNISPRESLGFTGADSLIT